MKKSRKGRRTSKECLYFHQTLQLSAECRRGSNSSPRTIEWLLSKESRTSWSRRKKTGSYYSLPEHLKSGANNRKWERQTLNSLFVHDYEKHGKRLDPQLWRDEELLQEQHKSTRATWEFMRRFQGDEQQARKKEKKKEERESERERQNTFIFFFPQYQHVSFDPFPTRQTWHCLLVWSHRFYLPMTWEVWAKAIPQFQLDRFSQSRVTKRKTLN